jgi:hypothetical protein
MIISSDITNPINKPKKYINLDIIVLLMNFVLIKQSPVINIHQNVIGGVDAIVSPVLVVIFIK